MTGKMDLAFIYDPGTIRGVKFEPILTEDLFLVAPKPLLAAGSVDRAEIAAEDVARLDLVLPTKIHTVRQLVDLNFRRVGVDARVIAEIESVPTIARAVWAGLERPSFRGHRQMRLLRGTTTWPCNGSPRHRCR